MKYLTRLHTKFLIGYHENFVHINNTNQIIQN